LGQKGTEKKGHTGIVPPTGTHRKKETETKAQGEKKKRKANQTNPHYITVPGGEQGGGKKVATKGPASENKAQPRSKKDRH